MRPGASTPVIYTCDLHSSVYHHLAASDARGLSLTHLDAHCDLKGTLIDLERGRAWLLRSDLPISASTYLSHLVARAMVHDVEWVHDEVGGRENDLGTVLYTTDLDRLPYRLLRRPTAPSLPISYRESRYDDWRHRDEDRVLDIDWDFFADWGKSAERTAHEIEQLLADKLEVAPRRVYVAYSSDYSRPGRDAYRIFVERLAQRLSARIEAVPEAPVPRAGAVVRGLPAPLRRVLRRQAVRLKRLLIRSASF